VRESATIVPGGCCEAVRFGATRGGTADRLGRRANGPAAFVSL